MYLSEIQQAFCSAYNRQPSGAVRAPGRVNLIGEHTDYNDGFVLPIAIERHTIACYTPRDDNLVNLRTMQSDQSASARLDEEVSSGKPVWANYCKGVLAGLLGRGVELRGADILFSSDVPLGGGLSSSASLEVATAMAMLEVADQSGRLSQRDIALICQQAEHDFAGAPCGIMDQSIAVMGRAGHAMLLDCRDGAVTHVPFDDPRIVLLVADTQVKHDISDGGYAARRRQCCVTAGRLGVASLRDADMKMLERSDLTDKELMRARHVIGEIARTLEAVEALKVGDYHRFGKLMYESHASLRDDYEVSCDELDAIVSKAATCEGVFGARMTGGGFGGCAIVLADSGRAEAITQAVQDDFNEEFGRRCPIFATCAAAGAGKI